MECFTSKSTTPNLVSLIRHGKEFIGQDKLVVLTIMFEAGRVEFASLDIVLYKSKNWAKYEIENVYLKVEMSAYFVTVLKWKENRI